MAVLRPWMVLLIRLSPTDVSVAANPAGALPAGPVAELAVLTVPREGDGYLEGYLLVWNGVAAEAYLDNVEGDAFSRVRFVQPSDRSRIGAKEKQPGVTIPGHAELVMLQRGIHMHLTPKDPIAIGDTVTLDLAFRDGTVQTLSATVEGYRDADDLHHHDQSSAHWLEKLDGAAGRRGDD